MGAGIDALDNLKRTPLYLSAREGHTDIVEWLLSNGANANISNLVKLKRNI